MYVLCVVEVCVCEWVVTDCDVRVCVWVMTDCGR